jgi:hypothetical protein
MDIHITPEIVRVVCGTVLLVTLVVIALQCPDLLPVFLEHLS